jgi:NSS family neurotransmitter:Na+ symporter
MIFAAMSTVTAVFENIISFGMDKWGWSRRKSCIINLCLLLVLCLPCVLGFNVLAFIKPLGEGSNIMDLEDFIVSTLLLPIGSFIFVLFCTSKKGWGWDNFVAEANTGKGLKVKPWMKTYMKYILPVLMFIFIVISIVTFFWPNIFAF